MKNIYSILFLLVLLNFSPSHGSLCDQCICLPTLQLINCKKATFAQLPDQDPPLKKYIQLLLDDCSYLASISPVHLLMALPELRFLSIRNNPTCFTSAPPTHLQVTGKITLCSFSTSHLVSSSSHSTSMFLFSSVDKTRILAATTISTRSLITNHESTIKAHSTRFPPLSRWINRTIVSSTTIALQQTKNSPSTIINSTLINNKTSATLLPSRTTLPPPPTSSHTLHIHRIHHPGKIITISRWLVVKISVGVFCGTLMATWVLVKLFHRIRRMILRRRAMRRDMGIYVEIPLHALRNTRIPPNQSFAEDSSSDDDIVVFRR